MAKCGEKVECYSRVTGYFRPVKNWNKGKLSELADRLMFKVDGGMRIPGLLSKNK